MDATATNPANLRHPRALYLLFFAELWERFSYYGMRALLVLYLTSQVMEGGFGYTRENALEIYAVFTGLIYLTPLVGGLLADKVLGQRKAIFIGGILMMLGQLSMSYSEFGDLGVRREWLNFGLGLLIVANGFFKPNISTLVGKLYSENDPRKDSAFTIFYLGINIGAFICPYICGTLGEQVGWSYGFLAAAVGILLGVTIFFLKHNILGKIGLPPKNPEQDRLVGRDWLDVLLYVIGCIALVYGFLALWGSLGESAKSLITTVASIAGGAALLYVIFTNTKGSVQWQRVIVLLVLCFFNVFFWASFEQAGGTFNLFAAENTQRQFGSFEIPASWFQSVNSFWIFVLAPFFSWLWLRLNTIGKNPNIPVKFSIGLLLVGLGFVVMSGATKLADGGALVSPMWLISVYLFHTIGELCLSPIGLSMITKLSPARIVSVMMGLWFASTALGNYLAGVMESILENYLPSMHLYDFLTLSSLAAGFALLLLSPILKRMMGGIS